MIKIWVESTKFDASQRFADQARLILEKGWWSDLGVAEMYMQIIVKNIPNESLVKELKHKIVKTK